MGTVRQEPASAAHCVNRGRGSRLSPCRGSRVVPRTVLRLGACLAILLGLPVVGTGPCHAAHEWRGYWAGPATLETLSEAVGDGPDLQVAHCQPFSLPGLSFSKVRCRVGAGLGEVHAGVLRGPGYADHHLGWGRWLAAGGWRLFAGARLFGLRAGDRQWPWLPAGTLLAGLRLGQEGHLRILAGAVDLGAADPRRVPPLFLGRVLWRYTELEAVIERSVTYRMPAETTLLMTVRWGVLGLTHGLRWGTGETLLRVSVQTGRYEVDVGGAWHPELGWSPRFAVSRSKGG
jgi:hypothetical protein